MRILTLLLLLALSACSTTKPTTRKTTRQDRATAEYEARTAARRNDPRPATTPGRETLPASTTADRPADAPAPAPSAVSVPTTRSVGEWVVAAVKSKFLAIDSTTVRVYMNLTVKSPTSDVVTEPADFIGHFQMAYVVYPDYNNRDRLGYGNVPLTTQSVTREGDHLALTFDVKRPKEAVNAILLAEITETNTGAKARNDLAIRFRAPKLSDRYSLFDKTGRLPQLRNYVNAGDTVIIRDVTGTGRSLLGVRYRHEFDAASSPMNTSSRPAPRSLATDSSLTITTGEPFVLPKEGLYFFSEDTTDASGIGLVVTDRRFPKLTRPEKLIKPVLYVSTSTEIAELNQAQDTKKAFDRYWLSLMSGNEEVARRTLKAYFDRVEDANRLFTSYKEGWKTDKGMIYIVLGAPDRVQRNREREVWVYNRRASVSEISFTFTKKPNQFVEDHYELVRYLEYQPIWYPIVEAWRTGAIRD